MEFDEVRRIYYETLNVLATETNKTIEELDIEISKAVDDCKNVEDIMIRASEILNE